MVPVSWVTRLPKGLREQPGWVFIGVLVALAGLGFVTGLGKSAVTEAIGANGLRGWGGFLMVTGILVTYATWRANPALEKMALRWLAFAVLAYVAWLAVTVPIELSVMPVTMGVILSGLAEIRVGFIKLMFRLALAQEKHNTTGGDSE